MVRYTTWQRRLARRTRYIAGSTSGKHIWVQADISSGRTSDIRLNTRTEETLTWPGRRLCVKANCFYAWLFVTGHRSIYADSCSNTPQTLLTTVLVEADIQSRRLHRHVPQPSSTSCWSQTTGVRFGHLNGEQALHIRTKKMKSRRFRRGKSRRVFGNVRGELVWGEVVNIPVKWL